MLSCPHAIPKLFSDFCLYRESRLFMTFKYSKSSEFQLLIMHRGYTRIHKIIIELCSFVYNNRNSTNIIKQLKAAGWKHVSTRGSHHKYRHPITGKSVIVPHPKKDLPLGTAESILKHAGLK